MATIDPALLAAVRQSKSEVAKQESHRRQLRRTSARKRAQKEVIAARSEARKAEIGARTQRDIEVLKARAEQRAGEREAREATKRGSTEERVGRGIGTGVSGTGRAIGSSEILSTTLWTMFGLIIVYLLVTKANQFSGFTGSLSDLLHKATSTAPLFQVASKNG